MNVYLKDFNEVDKGVFDSIGEALNADNAEKLCELVPSLSIEEANDWIDSYYDFSRIIEEKRETGVDDTPEITQQQNLIKSLLIRSKLPSNGIENN